MRLPGRRPPVSIVRATEYGGQPRIGIACTQLGGQYTARQARRVVDEWCDYFAAGPGPMLHVEFLSRTPKRLFDALVSQTQLQSLGVKWGDYDDLTPLVGMRKLTTLRLGGASRLRSLEPLGELPALQKLMVESLKHVHELAPLGRLTALRELEVGGDWLGSRNVHVDSIDFLREMPRLRALVLHTMIVDSKDYTPLLSLPSLRELRVMPTRGMRPTHDELAAAIPALQPLR